MCQDFFKGIAPVIAVPVVAAVNGGFRQSGMLAHHPAEILYEAEHIVSRRMMADERTGLQRSSVKLKRTAAVSHVDPKRNPVVFALPEAHGIRSGFHTEALTAALRAGDEIPGQLVCICLYFPGKVAVAPFPGISQNQSLREEGVW